MKVKKNTKVIYTLIPILGLLLLLSPCKVRNYIQENLNLPQTEVSNKSKTTFNNSKCNNLEIVTKTIVKTKKLFQQSPIITPNYKLTFGAVVYCINFLQLPVNRSCTSSKIPLYILYQNFKNYL
ncbi:hypothetical protein R3X25_02115 [Lutibacter sp. TH_r2]|uniref:hypothetical protein n=1 Tax=Lutibacter sp. TH_r2 TaxID=3082083 RepID=UPI00295570B1|nr:hypothetical protein [Lutibacter sp. TH_r2]MDV7186063.1 hypothetical protein [Lutibacter sp. TH_r2]